MNSALFVVGIIVLLLGIAAYGYTITETDTYFFGAVEDQTARKPYERLSIPMILAGVLLTILSIVVPERERIYEREEYTTHDVPGKRRRVVVREQVE